MTNLPKLYTSRWANKDLAHLPCVPVGISRGAPKFRLDYRYRRAMMLAPERWMFGKSTDEFERAYTTQLEALGVERIVATLAKIADEEGGKPLVLLCFEPRGEPCHRRDFAEWFEEKVGIVIPELRTGMVPEKDGVQGRLF